MRGVCKSCHPCRQSGLSCAVILQEVEQDMPPSYSARGMRKLTHLSPDSSHRCLMAPSKDVPYLALPSCPELHRMSKPDMPSDGESQNLAGGSRNMSSFGECHRRTERPPTASTAFTVLPSQQPSFALTHGLPTCCSSYLEPSCTQLFAWPTPTRSSGLYLNLLLERATLIPTILKQTPLPESLNAHTVFLLRANPCCNYIFVLFFFNCLK